MLHRKLTFSLFLSLATIGVAPAASVNVIAAVRNFCGVTALGLVENATGFSDQGGVVRYYLQVSDDESRPPGHMIDRPKQSDQHPTNASRLQPGPGLGSPPDDDTSSLPPPSRSTAQSLYQLGLFAAALLLIRLLGPRFLMPADSERETRRPYSGRKPPPALHTTEERRQSIRES